MAPDQAWENLTEKQEANLKELLQYNLKSVRVYLLKEYFNGFGDDVSPPLRHNDFVHFVLYTTDSRYNKGGNAHLKTYGFGVTLLDGFISNWLTSCHIWRMGMLHFL